MELLITPKEAARRLGVSAVTLWRLKRAGLIKPVKIGVRCVRYRVSDIEAIAKGDKTASTQASGT